MWSIYMYSVRTAQTVIGLYLMLMTLICVLGDLLLSHLDEKHLPLKCVADTVTHAFVAGLSCAVVIRMELSPLNTTKLKLCIVAMALGSVLDIDHFVMAGSLSLKEAVHLSSRPLLHCSTLTFGICLILWLLQRFTTIKSRTFNLLWLLVWLSWSSHHLRDAHRQGLWLCPFGSLPAIPYSLYMALILGLPLALSEILAIQRYFYYTFQTERPPRLQQYLAQV